MRNEGRVNVLLPNCTLAQSAIAAACIGAWMTAGWLLALPDNAYLVLGVPIVISYQRLVARRPLRALWRFDGAPLGFDRPILCAAAIFAAWPALALAAAFVTSANSGPDVVA